MTPARTTALAGRPKAPRGFTLLELMLSLVVTAFVGLGIASMMNMVSASESMDRDSRTVLLRSHAAQMRMRAYLDPALCVIAHDPSRGVAIWLADEKPNDNVHVSELRVLWWSAGSGTLRLERVDWPDAWPPELIDEEDVILPPGTDFFAAMEAQRAAGLTVFETILEEVDAFSVDYEPASVQDARLLRMTVTLTAGETQRDVLMTFGLSNYDKPYE